MHQNSHADHLLRNPLVLLGILSMVVLLCAVVYLHPFGDEFSMDDSYIHLVYAENLAEGRGLYFSFPDEQGVGSTSILWVTLLAGGHRIGLSMVVLAKAMGAFSLIISAFTVFLLLRPILKAGMAWLAALLVVVSGNMVWFALSGMETMLFVMLGLLALLAYRHQRWLFLGILMGGLTLTRPEGVMFPAALGIVELIRLRRLSRPLVLSLLICLLICSPWYAYLYMRTGHFLPTSAVGKQLTYRVGIQYVLETRGGLAWLDKVPELVYLGSWVVYWLEFTLGGMALPAPHIPLATVAQGLTYSFSLWAVPAWALVFVLIVAGIRRYGKFSRWRTWLADNDRRVWVLFATWIILHNLAFMFFMPVPGTASRYGAINHVFLWVFLVLGLNTFSDRRLLSLLFLGMLLLVSAVNTVYWDKVYQANLEHMHIVRIRAAHYIRDQMPPDTLCAASDVGAIRYFSQKPIVDMGALVNPDAGYWFLEGFSDRYLIEQGATCLVVPGRMNQAGEGWFDIVKILGLAESPRLALEQLAIFSIDHERWLLGYLPTNNYQESVVIYNLRSQ